MVTCFNQPMPSRLGSVKLTFAVAGLALLVANSSQADTINYSFVNFELPDSGNTAGVGTNMNGIANNGAAVGVAINDNGNDNNFVRNPNGSTTGPLNIDASTNAMAFGINSGGNVVGMVNGAAFYLPSGGSAQTLTQVGGGSTAFGINDDGNIVGQLTEGVSTPGFYLASNASTSFTTILAPPGVGTEDVNAQGINDNGLIVGFYVNTMGEDQGFDALISNAVGGVLTGTAIANPVIPMNVPGEPGATLVFVQILGINDEGLAVGYYQDSTGSQHGLLYNTITGQYTFLDDPSEAVRRQAARALGQIGPAAKAAIPALIKQLETREPVPPGNPPSSEQPPTLPPQHPQARRG